MNKQTVSSRLLFRHWLISLSIVFVAIQLVGCMTPGEIGVLLRGEPQTYYDRDSLLLEASRPDIINIISEVGKSSGYEVKRIGREMLSLSSGRGIGSQFKTEFISGEMNSIGINVALAEEGKKIDFTIILVTNRKIDVYKEATRIMNDFKSKLLERLKQQ